MYAFVLLGFLALASAAPQYYNCPYYDCYRGYPSYYNYGYLGNFGQNMQRFWNDYEKYMMGINKMVADVNRRIYYPSNLYTEKIEGNEYVIRITLPDYEEKDITVNAKKGFFVVQAVHKVEGIPERNYLNSRTLPDFVNEAGSWSFENGILEITFPLKNGENTDSVTTEAAVTDAPHSRENLKLDNGANNNINERGSLKRGGLQPTFGVFNEIPRRTSMEATTYVGDLKSEVTVLPARY